MALGASLEMKAIPKEWGEGSIKGPEILALLEKRY